MMKFWSLVSCRGKIVVRLVIGMALVLAAMPAWAQTRAENVAQCNDNDPDLKIAGCTALIQSGQGTAAALAMVYGNRGMAYSLKGQNDKAIADLNKAITLGPSNPNNYNGRGLTYWHTKQYDEAIADFTKAIALKPDFAVAYNNRGNVYDDKGFYDQAIVDYAKAIALKPDYANAYYNRGLTYEHKGQRTQAIADLSTALKLDPGMTKAQENLTRLSATFQPGPPLLSPGQMKGQMDADFNASGGNTKIEKIETPSFKIDPQLR
jgi:tetratricopeptide (TPR) repeat protein